MDNGNWSYEDNSVSVPEMSQPRRELGRFCLINLPVKRQSILTLVCLSVDVRIRFGAACKSLKALSLMRDYIPDFPPVLLIP